MSKDPLGIRNSSMDQLKKEVFEQLRPYTLKYLRVLRAVLESDSSTLTISNRYTNEIKLKKSTSPQDILDVIALDGPRIDVPENFDDHTFPLIDILISPTDLDNAGLELPVHKIQLIPGIDSYIGNDLGIQPFRYIEIDGESYTRREGFRKLYGKYGVELDKVMTIHSEKVYGYFAKFYRAFARLLEALIDLVKGKSDSEQVILINNFLMSNFGLNISSLSKFEEVLATFRKQNLQKLVEIVHFLGFSLIISRDIDDTGRLPIVDEDFPEGGVVIKQSMSRGEVFQEIRLYRNPDLET